MKDTLKTILNQRIQIHKQQVEKLDKLPPFKEFKTSNKEETIKKFIDLQLQREMQQKHEGAILEIMELLKIIEGL